jgi:DNA-binding LacI/PurR family transcriptional regulator
MLSRWSKSLATPPAIKVQMIPTKTRRKGLREVANLAKVSVATVSRVASGNTHVRQGIKDRVRNAALEIGVDLSRKNKPKALAFLLSNREVLHPFHSHILVGAETACASRGWDMLFLSFRYQANVPWKALHLPQAVRRHDTVRGVVLAGTNSTNLIDFLQYSEIPFVVLGNNVLSDGNERQFDSVCSDDIRGACEMTRYLQSLHHRDIWFVGNTVEPWSQRCFQGYQQAMKELGLAGRVSSMDSHDATEVGYLATKSLLSRNESVSAIVGASDETAQGIYKALRDSGLQIPRDVSVAGCNDTVGSLLHPALTTVREFPEQLGKTMVECVLNRIENPGAAPQQVTIPTELVKRWSCEELRLISHEGPSQVMATAIT